jgi:glycine/D-amino acid oxidase-like deaminating enzyme
MAPREHEVIVVGAGIVGLTTAVLLAQAGRRVAVVTAEPVGGGSTGRSAGVISRLHGTAYRRMQGETAPRNAAAHRAANEAGFTWLERLLERRDVPFERRDALLVALEPAGTRRIDDEQLAALRAGLNVQKLRRPDLPFPTSGALRLPDQILVDPRELLTELAIEARELGVELSEHERVLAVQLPLAGTPRLLTDRGEWAAPQVILATGTPLLERGLYLLKTQALRIMALRGSGVDPALPLVTAVGPTGSTTIATDRTGGATVVGAAHPVGVGGPESRYAAGLERFAEERLPGFQLEDIWSGQDYRPFNPIAFAGVLPRSGGRVRFATGFDGWGLTAGAAAALRISAEVLGTDRPGWATVIGRRATRPVSVAIGASADARAAARRIGGVLRVTAEDRRLLGEGQGIVHRAGRGVVATSRVDEVVRSVSARCTRFGGVLVWNDVELSWDCPVCGSRFSPDGGVLEGGARIPLPPIEDPADWGGAPRGR